jgi:hypothetical protein
LIELLLVIISNLSDIDLVCFNCPQIDFDNLSEQATDTTGLTVARGTPVCRGKYKGVAKVITRLADAATIKQVGQKITF